ncbi:MAG: DUF362 domain-containing protein [Acidobacteria bacterium]|nr:DUF362 domain-containing protein [Acidobacteriota bacterium]MCA1651018.1 DUF362 domain-containing protein [Acidobacteriota bacterium]
MNRRTFVFSATLGALNLGLGRLSFGQGRSRLESLEIDVHAPDLPLSPLGMPGLFPGKVVEVFHEESIVDRRVSRAAIHTMLEDGMKALTGESISRNAWARFVVPADVVAIKVNPSGVPGTVSSIPLVREVIQALNSVGVPNKNIIVYDRNSNQLEVNGYHALVPPGVRVVGLDQRWSVEGETRGGYDPNVFCEMDCFGERETRSYLASVVATDATKIINLPCLKEHNASGVTGCLKNLAYGSFNNVARTHVDPKTYTDPVIAVMCTAAPLRSKAVLHIMDGIRAVYHSGPFAWNPDFVWEAKTLLIGTDPVAVDRIELEIVERKRREVGVPSLWDHNPEYLGTSADMQRSARKSPYYREPGHIRTAAELGLGKWELNQIDHRKLRVV